jgi:hypothetical protein
MLQVLIVHTQKKTLNVFKSIQILTYLSYILDKLILFGYLGLTYFEDVIYLLYTLL